MNVWNFQSFFMFDEVILKVSLKAFIYSWWFYKYTLTLSYTYFEFGLTSQYTESIKIKI